MDHTITQQRPGREVINNRAVTTPRQCTLTERVGINDQLDMGTLAGSTRAVVVGVEERTDINQRIGATPRAITTILDTIPGRRGTDCLLELHRTSTIQHEPPNQTIHGPCQTQLTIGLDRFGQLDQRFGTLPPHPSNPFAISNRQRRDDLDQLGLLSYA